MSLDVSLRKVVTEERAVFSWDGMTHNMAPMAHWAGIRQACWEPDTLGITVAGDLIPLLEAGLKKLESEPEEAKKFEPSNKWGDYGGFVEFVRDYLAACREYPDATIKVDR